MHFCGPVPASKRKPNTDRTRCKIRHKYLPPWFECSYTKDTISPTVPQSCQKHISQLYKIVVVKRSEMQSSRASAQFRHSRQRQDSIHNFACLGFGSASAALCIGVASVSNEVPQARLGLVTMYILCLVCLRNINLNLRLNKRQYILIFILCFVQWFSRSLTGILGVF